MQDFLLSGASAGLPVGGSGVVVKGIAGVTSDAILKGAVYAGEDVSGELLTGVFGVGKFAIDAAIFGLAFKQCGD